MMVEMQQEKVSIIRLIKRYNTSCKGCTHDIIANMAKTFPGDCYDVIIAKRDKWCSNLVSRNFKVFLLSGVPFELRAALLPTPTPEPVCRPTKYHTNCII
jgi:hypothetical protein